MLFLYVNVCIFKNYVPQLTVYTTLSGFLVRFYFQLYTCDNLWEGLIWYVANSLRSSDWKVSNKFRKIGTADTVPNKPA